MVLHVVVNSDVTFGHKSPALKMDYIGLHVYNWIDANVCLSGSEWGGYNAGCLLEWAHGL